MFLLFLFSSAALALLMPVAVATRPGVACWQEVPAGLIRDLWDRTRQLSSRLPKEAKVARRLLPKFCTGCPKRVIGWLELRELIDVYQRGVFSSRAIQKLLPPDYEPLLYRLQGTLRRCVSASKPSKWFKLIKKVKQKIKKSAANRWKAAREFTFILRWSDELLHML